MDPAPGLSAQALSPHQQACMGVHVHTHTHAYTHTHTCSQEYTHTHGDAEKGMAKTGLGQECRLVL